MCVCVFVCVQEFAQFWAGARERVRCLVFRWHWWSAKQVMLSRCAFEWQACADAFERACLLLGRCERDAERVLTSWCVFIGAVLVQVLVLQNYCQKQPWSRASWGIIVDRCKIVAPRDKSNWHSGLQHSMLGRFFPFVESLALVFALVKGERSRGVLVVCLAGSVAGRSPVLRDHDLFCSMMQIKYLSTLHGAVPTSVYEVV